MRRTALVLALAAVTLTACGGAAEQPTTSSAAPVTETAEAGSQKLSDAFSTATASQPWSTNVERVELDGKAVIVRSKLAKDAGAEAVPMCEAAWTAAETAAVEFQSVTVRSADDSSIASRNKLRDEASCSAV
jgi:hypothetical protein